MTRCQCEHVRHFPQASEPEFADIPRDGHAYQAVDAGEHRAMFVGEVCDTCAATCVADYLIKA